MHSRQFHFQIWRFSIHLANPFAKSSLVTIALPCVATTLAKSSLVAVVPHSLRWLAIGRIRGRTRG